jgi:cell division septation protein DedD
MAGEAWRPSVFRFADANLYGDMTDPSNRNANWRMRYPSDKYTMQRIDKSPHELVKGNILPVRLSITGAEDFVIKRMEVVIYRAQRGGARKRLDIVSLDPAVVQQGERLTLQLNHSFPAEDVDLYVVDANGYEHKVEPRVINTARDKIGIVTDPPVFSAQGQYQVKLVDRTQPYQEFRDSEYFEYLGLRASRRIAQRQRPAAVPKPPCPPASSSSIQSVKLPKVPTRQEPQYGSVMPAAQMMQPGVPMAPATGPAVVVPPAPARVSAPAHTSGRYTIQIGAYNTQATAMKAVQKAQRYGYSAYIAESVKQGRRIFRVRVGRYPNRSLASQDAGRLQYHGFDTWITTL